MDLEKANISHNKRIKAFEKLVKEIFNLSNEEAIKLAQSVNYDAKKLFKFSDYPEIRKKANKLFSQFQKDLKKIIVNGVTSEWENSNLANNQLALNVMNLKSLEEITANQRKYFNNNQSASNAFLRRKIMGLDLSDRVWNLTQQYKAGLEQALTVGIADGRSAAELSRDIREYLNNPNKLFRRVRDFENNLNLSSRAKEYQPGQGLYRSSYKNALRLTGTEINMAYRTADYYRWLQLDFVVGVEIKLSKNHTIKDPKTGKSIPFYDICDELQGKYPKDFMFVGWHPNCRCFAIPILKSREEFFDKTKSSREVKEIPQNFKEWISKNEERILKSKSVPYFISENTKAVPELYIAISKKHESSFSIRVQKLVQGLNVHITPTNIKSYNRIIEKAHKDYNDNIYNVKDIVRTTIVAEHSQIDSILKKVNEEFNIYRYKKQSFKESGYSGNIFNIKTSNGTFAEIQVNTPQMIYGKEKDAKLILGEEIFNTIKRKSGLEHGLGHSWYEEVRKLNEDTDKKLIFELNKLQRDYYNALKRIII